MSSLTGQTPASDYGGLLNVNAGAVVGLTNVLQPVTDGFGSFTPLSLSTIALNITRSGYTFQLDGVAITSLSVDINSMCTPNPIALGTGYLLPPVGHTAQRPGSPSNGMFRYNTDTQQFEGYINGAWSNFTGSVISVLGTPNQIVTSGVGTVTVGLANNAIFPGTGSVQLPGGTSAQRSGAAGSIRFNSQFSVFESTIDGAAWATIQTSSTGVISVSGTANRINVSPNVGLPIVDISGSYVGQTSITTLGTISTGVWNGTVIPLAYGGTNANLTASNGGIVYSSSSALSILSGTSQASSVLLSGASSAPTWSNAAYPASTTINQLLYSSSSNVIAGLTTANNGVLVTSNSGVPSISSTIPLATQNNITQLGTITTGVWNGTAVSVSYGGTGDSTFTAYMPICGGTTPTGVMQSVATGTAGYVLTYNSSSSLPTWQNVASAVTSVSGTLNQIDASPTTGNVIISIDAAYVGQTSITTLGTIATGVWHGTTIDVAHGGTGDTSFALNQPIIGGTTSAGVLQTVATGGASSGYVLTFNSAVTAPTWQAASGGVSSVTGTANRITASPTTGNVIVDIDAAYVGQTSITTLGTIATGTWHGSVIPLAYGGTNANLTATVNNLVYSSASAFVLLATANNGTLITSAGGVPSISSTLPSAVQGNITSVGALASGSLAAGFTPVTVPLGGTGNTTFTAYSVICAGTTATGTFQNVSGVGTAAQVLTSNGAGALPSWQAAGGGGSGSSVSNTVVVSNSFSVGNIIYLNVGVYTLAEANSAAAAEAIGIVTTASGSQFTVTTSGYITGWTHGLTAGQVGWLSDATPGLLTATAPVTVGNIQKPMFVADSTTSGYVINYRGEVIPTPLTTPFALSIGGTGANLTASNGGIVYSNATTLGILAGTSTANQILMSGSSTTPAWSTATYPATTTASQILYSSSSNTVAGLATANSGVLITGGSGIPSISSTLPSGITLVAPVLGTPASGTLTNCTGLLVTGGGTGLATLTTAYGLVAAGTTATGALQNAGTGASGQVYISGGSSALGTWTNPASGIPVNQTGATVTMAAGNRYICNHSGAITFTVPATAAIGDTFSIRGFSSGGWIVQMNTGQTCYTGASNTTSAGTITSGTIYDSITIECMVANVSFTITSGYGTFTTA